VLRRALDQHPLHVSSRRTPDGKTSIAVMVVMELDEGFFAADEKSRRAMAQPLAALRQSQTEFADPAKGAFHAPWCAWLAPEARVLGEEEQSTVDPKSQQASLVIKNDETG